ncbi:TPA: hypothetical protein ACH3X2_010746 [Trebouxia sp. C0005]
MLHNTLSVTYHKALMLQVICKMYSLLSRTFQPPNPINSQTVFSAPCHSRDFFPDIFNISLALTACWLMIPPNMHLSNSDLHVSCHCYLSVKLAIRHTLSLDLTAATVSDLWLLVD